MRPNYLIAGVVLLCLATYSRAVVPGTVPTSSAATTNVAATTTAAAATTNNGAGKGSSGASRGNLLCAGLLGSGFLGNVLTLAPLPVTGTSDPNTAIQFTRIWSDSQHATVGGKSDIPATQGTPVVAIVKLPIVFSAADRQKLEESGWKQRENGGGHGVTYCLQRTGHPDVAAASMVQGMICVTAEP